MKPSTWVNWQTYNKSIETCTSEKMLKIFFSFLHCCFIWRRCQMHAIVLVLVCGNTVYFNNLSVHLKLLLKMLFKCGVCVVGYDRWSSALQMCVIVLFLLYQVKKYHCTLCIYRNKKVRSLDLYWKVVLRRFIQCFTEFLFFTIFLVLLYLHKFLWD